jgi:hypothetical protein
MNIKAIWRLYKNRHCKVVAPISYSITIEIQINLLIIYYFHMKK